MNDALKHHLINLVDRLGNQPVPAAALGSPVAETFQHEFQYIMTLLESSDLTDDFKIARLMESADCTYWDNC